MLVLMENIPHTSARAPLDHGLAPSVISHIERFLFVQHCARQKGINKSRTQRSPFCTFSHLQASADMLSGCKSLFGGGSVKQDGDAFPSNCGGGQRGCGESDGSSDFVFNRFLSKGDVFGFEALEKHEGDAFFQPITFWSGLKKLQVGGIAH